MLRKNTSLIIIVVTILIAISFFLLSNGKFLPQDQKQNDDRLTNFDSKAISPKKQPNEYNSNKTANSMTDFDKTKSFTATIKTSAGDIILSLNADATPITVKNFVTLAGKKFYDNTIFHRVIKGFMIQGGDPTGTGTGGPGYTFADEPFAGEYTRGTVAMANAGPDTNGSQFFIMHADTNLPKNYVIFGKVTSGMDTVDKIATAPTGSGDRPVDPVKILSIEIAVK